MELWIGAFNLGLLYAFLAIGTLITGRILKFNDITVDGSFTTGAELLEKFEQHLQSGVHFFAIHSVQYQIILYIWIANKAILQKKELWASLTDDTTINEGLIKICNFAV